MLVNRKLRLKYGIKLKTDIQKQSPRAALYVLEPLFNTAVDLQPSVNVQLYQKSHSTPGVFL